jgi:uncharacterized damage-inducible protein DinB
MKRLLWVAAAALTVAATASAQGDTANPVSAALRQRNAQYARNMVAAADAMPADKFTYHPTPDQMTYAHLVMHIAQSNTLLCSSISATAAPDLRDLKDTDAKEKLVAAIKTSFDYCTTALANVDDSKLGEQVKFFGNRTVSRAAAMMTLAIDWADHYSAQAGYLRMNGILPPSAQPRPQQQPAKQP